MATTLAVVVVAAALGCGGSADLAAAPSQPALTITGILPSSGRVSGGTPVTITGTGFRNGTTVTFGEIPATDVRVISRTSMTAIAPPHAAGDVDVVVANPDGRRARLTLRYTYVPDDADACAGCWDY